MSEATVGILIFRALALCASLKTKKAINDRFLHAVFSDPCSLSSMRSVIAIVNAVSTVVA